MLFEEHEVVQRAWRNNLNPDLRVLVFEVLKGEKKSYVVIAYTLLDAMEQPFDEDRIEVESLEQIQQLIHGGVIFKEPVYFFRRYVNNLLHVRVVPEWVNDII